MNSPLKILLYFIIFREREEESYSFFVNKIFNYEKKRFVLIFILYEKTKDLTKSSQVTTFYIYIILKKVKPKNDKGR